MSELVYTIEEAANEAGVSTSTIKREIADGRLIPTRIRGCVRIAREDLEGYIKQCRSVPTEKAGKSDFSTTGDELAALLGDMLTPSSSRGEPATVSQIIALDDRRRTRSRKRSTAG